MGRIILQPGAAEWRKQAILDGAGRHVADELKPYDPQTNEAAAWAVQRGSQELFINCRTFEVLYTGNRGGGKTACLLMDFAQHVGQGLGADWKGILFRHTYRELKDVVDKSRAIFPVIWPDAKFNETKMTWTWETGEQMLLGYMEHEKDYLSYHGHAYPWIGWEELTTWPDSSCYTRMMSCCRSANPRVPRKIRCTTNPYGPGFSWVKLRFQLPLQPGQIFGALIKDDETGDRRAINSDLRENLVLLNANPDYMKILRASARNPSELAAWLHGSWDITSGGMFDDIWLRVKDAMVLPPFQIPPSWRIDRSFDWGSSKPFSVGWWAQSDGSTVVLPGGRLLGTLPGDIFRIKEWYGWDGKNANRGLRMLAKDISKGIIEKELNWGIHDRVRRGIADASIFDDTNGNCIARDMEEGVEIHGARYRGVYFDPADKRSGTRKQGWEQVRKMMSAVLPVDSDGKPIPREEPGLFVTSECSQFIRTVPTIPRDDDDLDDVNTESEDHVADEVRYRCRKEHREMTQGRTSGSR